MADNFGLKIGIEGEKEFKKALSEVFKLCTQRPLKQGFLSGFVFWNISDASQGQNFSQIAHFTFH